VRTLAERLREHHTVTVVTYGRLPVEIAGVTIVAIDKRAPLLTRLYRYLRAFMQSARDAELVLVMNGASTELPFILASYLVKTKAFFVVGDVAAHEWVQTTILRKFLESTSMLRAKKVVLEVPNPRPEILPLDEYPVGALRAYEHDWETHLHTLGL
jgi:hypothetical protein